MMKVRSVKNLLLVVPIILVLSSCGTPLKQPAPPSTITPTPTPHVRGGNGEPDQLALKCPEEDTLFSLWLSHYAVLDIDPGNGETIYLKYENIPPSFFDFWIYANGSISNEGIYREVPIGYQGTANHPGDNNCPVQTFDGVIQMKGTITGSCENNTVRIHLVEEWINPTLDSDCGNASPGQGLFSAPELDLVFDLDDDYPSDFIQIPEGGPFHATYAYHVWLAGYDLPVVPLVPEGE